MLPFRCEASMTRAQFQVLKYLETIYCGVGASEPSKSVKKITINSVVLEPVPVCGKNAEGQPGCRPYAEVTTGGGNSDQGCQTIPSSIEYGSLTQFTSYDEEAVLSVNPGVKAQGDVTLKVYH